MSHLGNNDILPEQSLSELAKISGDQCLKNSFESTLISAHLH